MCCARLHRHQVHLISYGSVSLTLITTGLVFTIFAIFQKDSQIGKVWLAGPTTMVVGLVLCGKVIIDWGPAMTHGREGSINSLEQLNLSANALMLNGYDTLGNGNALKGFFPYEHSLLMSQQTPYLQPKIFGNNYSNGSIMGDVKKGTVVDANGNIRLVRPSTTQSPTSEMPSLSRLNGTNSNANNNSINVRRKGAVDCIIYDQFDVQTPSRQNSRKESNHNGALNHNMRVNNTTDERNWSINSENDNIVQKLWEAPFPLTLPIPQTSLQTTATQTYGSIKGNCSNSCVDVKCFCETPTSRQVRLRRCSYCGNADDEMSELEPPRVSLHSYENENDNAVHHIPSLSCNRGSVPDNRREISRHCAIRYTVPAASCRYEINNKHFLDDLSNYFSSYRQTTNTDLNTDLPAIAPSHVLIMNSNDDGADLLFQGETFVLNERNFFI